MSADSAITPSRTLEPKQRARTRAEELVALSENNVPEPVTEAAIVRLPVTHADGAVTTVSRRPSLQLRRLLIVFDVGSVVSAWGLAVIASAAVFRPLAGSWKTATAQLVLTVAIQLVAIATQRLYLARVSSVRSIELVRLTRSAVIAGVGALYVGSLLHSDFDVNRAILGAAVSLTLLSLFRGIYSSWLRAGRARGLYSRPIVIVGTNEEGLELWRLLDTHPELGFRVVGVTGRKLDYDRWPNTVPYLGAAEATLDALVATSSDGVLVASSALGPNELNAISRELLRHDVHVHLSSGLKGIDHRRLRSLPMAHEPIFYLERVRLTHSQVLIKRALDLVLATSALILVSPVLILAGLAVRLSDGGPAFFQQRRIGRDGKAFTVYKLRTMVPDAEARLSEVVASVGNARDDILFKLDNDPRRTRVGKLLESASIDELPQLFNVVLGTMSLVGPRPALPSEVAKFDDELLTRLSVPPGITGLWQVEARDNPSFSAYKRLDLFYVENWSVTLDLVLMIETVSAVFARLLGRRRSSASASTTS